MIMQTVKPTILVSSDVFDRMAKIISCGHIAESKLIPGTIHHLNNEYVITGAMGTGTGAGWAKLWGNQVISLANYNGDLPPLPYHLHSHEVDAGRRERGYVGMLLKHGNRELVCLSQFEFEIGVYVKQLSLF